MSYARYSLIEVRNSELLIKCSKIVVREPRNIKGNKGEKHIRLRSNTNNLPLNSCKVQQSPTNAGGWVTGYKSKLGCFYTH